MRRRTAHAVQRWSVRMDPNPSRWQRLMLILSAVVGVAGLIGALALGWLRPAGTISSTSKIVADRSNDTIWVVVAGRLHPALNLVSAQLIAGAPDKPTFVSAAEIAKWPKGPPVGIAGAIETPVATSPQVSRWAVCDTAPDTIGGAPVVTGIDGQLVLGEAAAKLAADQAVLLSYDQQIYLVADGMRMPLDLSDAAVAAGLGINREVSVAPMSQALFDALPAGGRIAVPQVPGAGGPGVDLGRPLPVGAVVAARDVAADSDRFFVVLGDGVQEISPVVAGMLQHRESYGLATAPHIAPDRLGGVARRHVLNIDRYPHSPPHIVDVTSAPVTCATWQQSTTERHATFAVVSGRTLPLSHDQQGKLVNLVGAGNGGVQANRVLVGTDAATFVTTTGEAVDSRAREAMWLIGPTGSRYGVPFDDNSLQGLGLALSALRPAPWAMLQVWPAGPELSRAAALTQYSSSSAAVLPTKVKEKP